MSILVDAETTFIVQGITGREAVNLTRECLDYGAGARIVGGVTPGRKGREVHGVPVFDTVDQAVAHHGRPIDGAVVTVPPAFTKDAVFEALENGVKLVVVVTERIPRRDVAEMVELATLRGARIIGPNCLGIIVPDVIKMGGIGGPARDAAKAYTPGPIGVISRSGGMTTEMSSTLSAAGLGQSTAVSIGGDAIIGSTYAELMPLFEADEQTQGIVIYTEPGGRMEAELARWVAENDSRLPIVAFMAGRFMDEMPGMSFGHAGTIVEGREDTASEKIARLAEAGITVAERIEDIPGLIVERLEAGRSPAGFERPEADRPHQNAGLDAPRKVATRPVKGGRRPTNPLRTRGWTPRGGNSS
jgi:succinyl-CoA synthetase alpha subunit